MKKTRTAVLLLAGTAVVALAPRAVLALRAGRCPCALQGDDDDLCLCACNIWWLWRGDAWYPRMLKQVEQLLTERMHEELTDRLLLPWKE